VTKKSSRLPVPDVERQQRRRQLRGADSVISQPEECVGTTTQLANTLIVDPAEVIQIEENLGPACRPLPRALRSSCGLIRLHDAGPLTWIACNPNAARRIVLILAVAPHGPDAGPLAYDANCPAALLANAVAVVIGVSPVWQPWRAAAEVAMNVQNCPLVALIIGNAGHLGTQSRVRPGVAVGVDDASTTGAAVVDGATSQDLHSEIDWGRPGVACRSSHCND
jgi:hypothetical protein